MKIFKSPLRYVSLMLYIISSTVGLAQQTQLPLPVHASTYSGNARGYWFVAPTSFTITGLKVAPEAGTGLQYIHLLKCHALLPVAFTSPSTNFTTLTYISGAPNNVVQPVNIPVSQGDTLVIMGTAGTSNSYSANGIHTTTIGSYSVPVGRAGTQASITGGPAVNFWGYDPLVNYELGRVFIYYQIASATDAALQGFVIPGDTICSSPSDITVTMKNYGPNTLHSVDVEWEVNNASQPPFSWNGILSVNDSTNVVIGSYHFTSGTPHSLRAWTAQPNNGPDTLNNLNDTIFKSQVFVKPSPSVTLADTFLVMCQGDSANLQLSFSGMDPWGFTLTNGNSSYTYTGLWGNSLSKLVAPGTSNLFTIQSVFDASGCTTDPGLNFTVFINPPPPAIITPLSSNACCEGDSVLLMASIGLNFSYQWLKNNVPVAGAANYLFAVKESGHYSVRVTSAAGCLGVSQPLQVLVFPNPVVFLGNDTNVVPGATVHLNAGPGYITYLWSTGAFTQSITVDSSGVGLGVKDIWIEVQSSNYCYGYDTIRINFVNNPGIEEDRNILDFRVYPNPTDGIVRLDFANGVPASGIIELTTIEGKQVRSFNLNMQRDPVHLDLGKLPDGVYFLRLSLEDGAGVTRIVIRH
jgi:hypothetical protein